jgi:PAS domain S-box-containing protein
VLEHFTKFAEVLPDIVIRFDTELRHRYINESVVRFTGIPATDYIGKTNEDLGLPPEKCREWRNLLQTVISQYETVEFDYVIPTLLGERFFHTVAFPEMNKQNLVIGVLCITRDVTPIFERRKEIEKLTNQVAEQQQQIIYLSQMKALADMASGVSHEINNPLTCIYGNLYKMQKLLKAVPEIAGEFQTHIDGIQNHSSRIKSVVESLKYFSYPTAFERHEVTFKMIVDKTLKLCQEKLLIRGINVEVNIDENLKIIGCEGSLIQAVYALLMNAKDAIEKQAEKWIKIEGHTNHSSVQISITDSGNGIDIETAHKMFFPFYSTKPVGQGQGLGLSVVKGIMDNHQGDIFYQLAHGNTQFILIFPK